MAEPAVLSSLGFALAAGLATFFSPCAYPLLPGYVAFYVEQTEGDTNLEGALSRGLLAGAGVVLTLGILIGLAYWIGSSVLQNVVRLEPVIGVLLILFGILVLVNRAPWISLALPKRRASLTGFGIFGAGYAAAAAGCVAPIFLGLVANALSLSSTEAAAVLGLYVATVVVLMVSLTVATGVGLQAGASRLDPYSHRLEQLAGGVMILAGMGQLYVALVIL
ncbi:MAG: cytochrome c biogenesis protein CcdA [Natrialbaceae archaeon]|nr:cytochrome c biogenesis protein CcdA [Natrialbaceae archaeon]